MGSVGFEDVASVVAVGADDNLLAIAFAFAFAAAAAVDC
jgi:hypothetical protein